MFAHKWAILIGVTKYDGVHHLQYCARDVSEMARALEDHLDFPPENITQIASGLEVQPTRARIFHHLGALEKEKKIEPDDLLFFYFSGHGYLDRNDYLLPSDATLNALKQTAISVQDIVEMLSGTKCKNIVVFLDACRENIQSGKGIKSIGEQTKEIVEKAGIVTFFSCDPEDRSYEIEALEQGSFTHCLLECIRKQAGITAEDLHNYLREQVPLTNSFHNKPAQQPYVIAVPRGKMLLPILQSNRTGEWDEFVANQQCQLRDLYNAGAITAICLNRVADFLTKFEKRTPDKKEQNLLRFIEQLCDRTLNENGFLMLWKAEERSPVKGPVTKRSLGRLSKRRRK